MDRESLPTANPTQTKAFRFFDNREKYLMFVTTCSEKEDVAARYRKEGKAEVNAKYAAMVESVDEAVGRVVATKPWRS